MAIQAIAIDRQDRVYAATSPDGKVYRVDASGKAEVFYDPHAKYIWALAFSKSGDLFVATGDQGEIHRVTASGAGSVFFRTEETHARSLAIDANDNLIVGHRSERADSARHARRPGIRAVSGAQARDHGGRGRAGWKRSTRPASETSSLRFRAPAPAAPAPPVPPRAVGGITLSVGGRPSPHPAAVPRRPRLSAIAGGSEIYRIQSDGYPRRVWSHAQDLVYALAFDAQGRLLAGTGNHGTIFRLDSDHSYTRLLNVAPTQVTGFCCGARRTHLRGHRQYRNHRRDRSRTRIVGHATKATCSTPARSPIGAV